jgi:ferritin-like metal-binding protein YciE
MSDALVQYLREARATEAALQQTLSVHIAATPPGAHRGRLEEHLRETRSHEQQLARRLDELEQPGQDPLGELFSLVSGSIGFGMGVARGATRAMLSLIGLPLSIFRDGGDADADRVLRNVRAEAASEALEVATYTAIERLAAAEGDDETAALAASIRAEEERMLEYLLGAAGEVAVPTGPPAPRAADRGRRAEGGKPKPSGGNGAAPPADARPPAPAAPDTRHPAPDPPRPAPATPPPAPETRPPALEEPTHVSEEPELVAEFAEPGAEDEAGAEVEIAEPWEGYDRMKAAEIQRRLEDSSDEVAAVVRLYESAGKNRQTVLRAAEQRLRTG